MKIGLIADNKSVIKHDLEIIQWLSCNPSVELTLLINQDVKSEGLWKLIRSFKFRSDPLEFIAYFLYLLISPKDIYDSKSGLTRNPFNIIFYRIKRYLHKLREFNRNKNG